MAASCTARRSTGVIADGTQSTTFGLVSRPPPAFRSSSRRSCAVVSKSEIAPPRNGRTATMWPGVRPIISLASSPRARISPLRSFSAITVGWRSRMPCPLT